jgi:predicted nucleic acid-binding Zn ribbon protein
MPTYLYVCTEGCGYREAHTALLADGNICVTADCCGQMRRDWKSEAANLPRANLRNH